MTDPVHRPRTLAPPPLVYAVGLLRRGGWRRASRWVSPPPRIGYAGLDRRWRSAWRTDAVGGVDHLAPSHHGQPYTGASELVTDRTVCLLAQPDLSRRRGGVCRRHAALGSFWPLVFAPLVWVIMRYGVIAHEEAHLCAKFGSAYNEYCAPCPALDLTERHRHAHHFHSPLVAARAVSMRRPAQPAEPLQPALVYTVTARQPARPGCIPARYTRGAKRSWASASAARSRSGWSTSAAWSNPARCSVGSTRRICSSPRPKPARQLAGAQSEAANAAHRTGTRAKTGGAEISQSGRAGCAHQCQTRRRAPGSPLSARNSTSRQPVALHRADRRCGRGGTRRSMSNPDRWSAPGSRCCAWRTRATRKSRCAWAKHKPARSRSAHRRRSNCGRHRAGTSPERARSRPGSRRGRTYLVKVTLLKAGRAHPPRHERQRGVGGQQSGGYRDIACRRGISARCNNPPCGWSTRSNRSRGAGRIVQYREDGVLVEAALPAGSRVIAAGAHKLHDRQKITPMPFNPASGSAL